MSHHDRRCCDRWGRNSFQGLRGILAIGVAGLIASTPTAAQVGHGDDDHTEARAVYDLLKFVTFPTTAVLARHSPLNVCLLGQSPSALRIAGMLKGKSTRGRPITVTRDAGHRHLAVCHVVILDRMQPWPRQIRTRSRYRSDVLMDFPTNGGRSTKSVDCS